MFLIYGLLLVAMIFGIVMLFVRQKERGTQMEGKKNGNEPNAARTNEGGNSQRGENSTGGSSAYSDRDHNSMGADNDEDIDSASANAQRQEDFSRYNN